jgi:hypothetical protein
VTPIARELLAPSLASFGRSVTLPAEAYAGWSVFRWEQEHFFDEGWVCLVHNQATSCGMDRCSWCG